MADGQAKYDEKLMLILRTAAAIFAEKGYHQASIRDISRATGISLSGLYYYVRSKEEILFRIQEHCFETLLENLDRLLARVEEPPRRLRLFVGNHLRFFANNMQEMRVLSHEATALTGDSREIVGALKRRYVGTCASILKELRPGTDAQELRAATFSLFGMVNWIYTWYHPGRDVPVEELAARMTEIFLNGYLAGAMPTVEAERAMDGAKGEPQPSIWRR